MVFDYKIVGIFDKDWYGISYCSDMRWWKGDEPYKNGWMWSSPMSQKDLDRYGLSNGM